MQNIGFSHHSEAGFHYLSVPSFDRTGLVTTCFTTRLGGVSEPPIDSMNLGFGRGDAREAVLENYRICGTGAGFPHERTVAFTQVHKNNIRVATDSDAGEAFLPEKREFDGIITNTPQLPIATYHADCIPIFLLDPIKRACGVVHAGWRGTAQKIAAEGVLAMGRAFGSSPGDILAAIGPGICKNCFETDSDVPDEMVKAFGASAFPHISQRGERFRVDLPLLNRTALAETGVPKSNISLSGECTSCKPDLYWSHRKTGGVRGCMMAVIMLK